MARLSDQGPLSIVRLTEGEAMTRQAITKHLAVLARRYLDLVSTRWDAALGRLAAMVEPGDRRRAAASVAAPQGGQVRYRAVDAHSGRPARAAPRPCAAPGDEVRLHATR